MDEIADDLRASGGIAGLTVEPVEESLRETDVDGLAHGAVRP
jgi:hypothetical protein